ncbi:Rrp1p [Lachancea thermotolerans CBS 6340]|uniref:KLTH0G14652p n=1 Tax=Lachancea thermotolerans (strain ATCC 56472 / CBS 6340 / NRRL Y-8284) TaxID=559295 RepID=C5DN71_LACTC|nr:KLTH0G14652p [Lachancea thermotolerans CBS 6340]CAR25232.1 KLTH0G14652p [Lachancea thermotolerans CBS 6340]
METSAFVKQLASNSRTVREEALESLKKYLTTKQFKDSKQLSFDKLWKGLYYAMWFSDRPRPQQRLATNLGELFVLYFDKADNQAGSGELTKNDKAFLKFSKAFWRVMCMEWYNIDHHRLDKYLLLVRRVLAHQLRYLQLREWSEEVVSAYIHSVLRKLPLSGDKKVYNGIPFHVIDILLDEWEKLVLGSPENGDDDDDDDSSNEEDEEAKLQEQRELIAATPLSQFVDIFRDLASNTDNIKVLRDKIKEDIFKDERLTRWGVLSAEEVPAIEDDGDDGEEWTGFN